MNNNHDELNDFTSPTVEEPAVEESAVEEPAVEEDIKAMLDKASKIPQPDISLLLETTAKAYSDMKDLEKQLDTLFAQKEKFHEELDIVLKAHIVILTNEFKNFAGYINSINNNAIKRDETSNNQAIDIKNTLEKNIKELRNTFFKSTKSMLLKVIFGTVGFCYVSFLFFFLILKFLG